MGTANLSPTFIPLMPATSSTSLSLSPKHRQLFERFSLLFEYPVTSILQHVEQMILISNEISPKQSRILEQFRKKIKSLTLTQLQEFYSDLIDMNPHFHPYMAGHLIGESYKRSIFLVKLRELFREHHHEPPSDELPDHLAVLLKFISIVEDTEVARSLLEDLILPALNIIIKKDNLAVENALMGTNPIQNPYVYLYIALKEFIIGLLNGDETRLKKEMNEI